MLYESRSYYFNDYVKRTKIKIMQNIKLVQIDIKKTFLMSLLDKKIAGRTIDLIEN